MKALNFNYTIIKWLLTGITITILFDWCVDGGFACRTEIRIIIDLVITGMTVGVWLGALAMDAVVEKLINGNREK